MKKVIDGKVYNTETAEQIADYSYSHSSDFHYIIERLYRTSKGSFFLHGEGGPMTKYAVDCGNNFTSGSSDIIQMNADEAMHWLEKHNFPEVIEEYFEDKIEEA